MRINNMVLTNRQRVLLQRACEDLLLVNQVKLESESLSRASRELYRNDAEDLRLLVALIGVEIVRGEIE